MGVWTNDIKKRMIAFSEKVAFEFQLRNQEETNDQNVKHLVAQIDVKGVDVLPDRDPDKNAMHGNRNDDDEVAKVSPTINAQTQSRKRENRRKQSKNIAVNSPKP